MNHRIALNFEDGIARFIRATPGETVADVAYRQGINIPLDCRGGARGTCKCLVEVGRYALDQDCIDGALSAKEAARGYVLTCQIRVESDYVLRMPASSTLCRASQARYEARISEVRQLSPGTIGLSLHDEALANLAFLPGQYVNLQVSGSEQRHAYSFSSLAKDGEVSLLIRNIPGGLTSSFLSGTTRAGDSLMMDGPLGSSYLHEIHRPLLMLAGDTGPAPFTMMLERIAEQGNARPLHLIYGVTHDTDLVRLERLKAFAERIPGFIWSVCVANADNGYPRKGYITERITAQHLHRGDVDIYPCGPPPVIETVERHLCEQDVRPTNFYYEKFAASTA